MTPSATTAVVVCDEQRSALTLVDIDVDKVVHQALRADVYHPGRRARSTELPSDDFGERFGIERNIAAVRAGAGMVAR